MAKNLQPLEKTSSSLFDSLSKETSVVQEEETLSVPVEGRRISVWAVVAFIFGFLGFLSLVHLGFLFFSVVSIVAGICAFYTIGRSGGEVTGKKLAGVGLAVGLASAIAGPCSSYVYEREFDRQADAFIRVWFENVKAGNIEQAHQMTNPYWRRATFVTRQDNIDYWMRLIGGEEEQHHGVHEFLSNPTLLTIWKLGDRAKFTYFKTIETLLTNSTEQTVRVYAVTAEPEEPGQKPQTFFLSFFVERNMNKTPEGDKLVGWTMHVSDRMPLSLGADGLPHGEE